MASLHAHFPFKITNDFEESFIWSVQASNSRTKKKQTEKERGQANTSKRGAENNKIFPIYIYIYIKVCRTLPNLSCQSTQCANSIVSIRSSHRSVCEEGPPIYRLPNIMNDLCENKFLSHCIVIRSTLVFFFILCSFQLNTYIECHSGEHTTKWNEHKKIYYKDEHT